jgi:hypothetical protein
MERQELSTFYSFSLTCCSRLAFGLLIVLVAVWLMALRTEDRVCVCYLKP